MKKYITKIQALGPVFCFGMILANINVYDLIFKLTIMTSRRSSAERK